MAYLAFFTQNLEITELYNQLKNLSIKNRVKNILYILVKRDIKKDTKDIIEDSIYLIKEGPNFKKEIGFISALNSSLVLKEYYNILKAEGYKIKSPNYKKTRYYNPNNKGRKNQT
jgi:hypothetical protein